MARSKKPVEELDDSKPKSPRTPKAAAQKLLKDAKDNYKLADEAWQDNRKQAIEDMKFRSLQQWPDKVREIREKANRPILVMDKLNQYIRQVVNDGRQNRPSIKVRPIDDKGDPQVAEAYEGIVRHILYLSNADAAFDTALDCAVGNGFGWMRVLADYSYPGAFDQDLKVVRVRNPVSILMDPNIQEADGSDARFAFVIDELSKEEFTKKYPNAKVTDWDNSQFSDGWKRENNIRVAEYWYREDQAETIFRLEDGTTVTEDEYAEAKANGAPTPKVIDERVVQIPKIKWCRLTGGEILEERDWLGKYIPIVPVFGNEWDIEGKVIYSGLVRAAKDAQRLYNYARSAFAERVALTPKAPWIAANGQVENNLAAWESSNIENVGVLTYDPQDINGTPVPPPQRVSPVDVPAGSAQDMQIAEHDIQASMGIYNANLGEKSNEKSGKAIMARQREGDTATFHYMDNLNRGIRALGRILVDLIPHYYGSRKIVRILGEDGDSKDAQTNGDQEQPVLDMGSMSIYNLGVGEYDVAVDSGPSYMTKRTEMAEFFGQLAQGNPQLFMLVADIWAKVQDVPEGDKIASRFKAMLPPQVQQAEQAEEAGEDPQVAAIKQQAGQIIQGLQGHLSQLTQQAQELAQENQQLKQREAAKMADVSVKAHQANTDAYDAETRRITAVMPAMQMDPQAIAQLVQQAVRDALMTPAPGTQGPSPQVAVPAPQMQGPPQGPQPQQPQGPNGPF